MRVENLVPQVYYKESRDFAFIGRLIELSINYMKTAADNVEIKLNENIDNYLLQLLADTLGFKLKHNYNTKDLLYVCSSLFELYKNKGSKDSIAKAVQLLINSQNIKQKVAWEVNLRWDAQKEKNLILEIPDKLSDVVLIEDLFDYILPAGITYSFIRISSEAHDADNKYSEIDLNDDAVFTDLSAEQAGGLFEIQNSEAQTGATKVPKLDSETEYSDIYLGNIGSNVVVEKENASENEGE